MECIILAGGLGTRLRSTIGDYPKCMAEVNKKPFLHYVFTYLQIQGFKRVILSLGYKHEVVLEWLANSKYDLEIDHVIEKEPLGTGGGIALALNKAQNPDTFVVNGDTMFQANMKQMLTFHLSAQAHTTLALKPMVKFDRYGLVRINEDGYITSFEEKKQVVEGLINGGIYIINKEKIHEFSFPEKWSFEKDYLECYIDKKIFSGYCDNGYFIDIGIPEDYKRAENDFKNLFS